MKFYDKNGNTHDSIIGAMVSDITCKADEFLKKKLPGFKEAEEAMMSEEDDLYSAVEDVVQPYKVISRTINDYEYPDSVMNMQPIDIQPANVEHQESVVETTSVADILKDQTTETKQFQRINIDYAHKEIQLINDSGDIIARSKLDDCLVKGTIDKALLDIMYPDGKVPDKISTNIQSVESTTTSLPVESSDNLGYDTMG